jgi:hypothetical protein
LSYFLASLLILSGGNGFILFLILILIVHGAEAVLGIASLVLRFRVLRLYFPNTLLLQGKGSPAIADDF